MKQFRECFHKCLLENRKRNLTVGGPIPQTGIPDWKQKQKQIKNDKEAAHQHSFFSVS